MIYFIIALFIIITILAGIVSFLIVTRKYKKESYTPLPKKLNIDNSKIKEIDKNIEVIKNEKSNNATDLSNSLNNMDI